MDEEFLIENGEIVKYLGKDHRIVIPDGVTSIGEGVFKGKSSTREVVIPEGVIEIKENAFNGCKNLTLVELPDSLESMGKRAFANSGITKLNFPAKLEKIEEKAFVNCPSLSEINVNSLNQLYTSVDGILYDATGKILLCLPSNYKNKEARISDGVTTIEEGALTKCINIEKIYLPASLEKMDNSAFGQGVVHCQIYVSHYEAFFEDWKNLSEIEVDPDNKTFKSIDGILYSADCKELYCMPENYQTKEFNVLEEVERITSGAFNNCEKLEKVKLPNGLDNLGGAFEGCTALKDVDMPHVRSLSGYAFKECINIRSFIMPEGVEYVGDYPFFGCDNLSVIELRGDKYFKEYGLEYLLNLKTIIAPKILLGDYTETNIKHAAVRGFLSFNERYTDPDVIDSYGKYISRFKNKILDEFITSDDVKSLSYFAKNGFITKKNFEKDFFIPAVDRKAEQIKAYLLNWKNEQEW